MGFELNDDVWLPIEGLSSQIRESRNSEVRGDLGSIEFWGDFEDVAGIELIADDWRSAEGLSSQVGE